MSQATNEVLMIRPVQFRKNEETAVNNYYQQESNLKADVVAKNAQKEFDNLVEVLVKFGVKVTIVDDDPRLDTPDALFPNNWISFHSNGDIALYPMFAPNRRRERRPEVLEKLESQGFVINNVVDYTDAESEAIFLEGTGSVVLDRVNRKAYCALSPRADEELLIEFCEDFEYTPVIFVANQTVLGKRLPIYHTNVMMCIGDTFAVICLDCIDDKKERKNVEQHLRTDGKTVIRITEEQVQHFAGNMLQVLGYNNESFIVMSTTAFKSLTDRQKITIETCGTILHSDLSVIEKHGGGSARCMIAEVFLRKK